MMTMRKRLAIALLVAAAAAIAGDGRAAAQTASTDGLRRQIERRFDVLPLRDGLALRPKSALNGVRSIELSGGTIAINGTPATGADARQAGRGRRSRAARGGPGCGRATCDVRRLGHGPDAAAGCRS